MPFRLPAVPEFWHGSNSNYPGEEGDRGMAKRPQQSAAPGLTRRQTSRAKREARIQRIVLISTAVIIVGVVGLLGYGLLNQYYFAPRHVLAKVGDKTITVQDFQNRVKFEYFIYSIQPYQFQQFDA